MKSSLRDLFKYQATENTFFRETGYFGEAREHAKVCILCWLDKVNAKSLDKETTLPWRADINKFFRQRRIKCPYTRALYIPWGRNRRYPPKGCVRLLEHAVVSGSGQ